MSHDQPPNPEFAKINAIHAIRELRASADARFVEQIELSYQLGATPAHATIQVGATSARATLRPLENADAVHLDALATGVLMGRITQFEIRARFVNRSERSIRFRENMLTVKDDAAFNPDARIGEINECA